MVAVLSKFTVVKGMAAQVKRAFIERPHLVENASGFLRLDVLSPCEHPEEIWLLTYWTDEHSYQAWHRSHTYHEAHKGIPKGLKLVPKSAEIRFFDHICS
jgi:heme-degrading monooxygenase HmoA